MPRRSSTASLPPDLSAQALDQARRRCEALGERLTAARLNAYAQLLSAQRPVSAYDLLAQLEAREQRKLAPLTVYRQLDFLTRVGLVHRLASSQSYVACEHPEHPHESLYLVCERCGRADELESAGLDRALSDAASSRGFHTHRRVVELQGVCGHCGDCASAASN